MQSPDFVFYMFLALGVGFGGVAVYARRQHLRERSMRPRKLGVGLSLARGVERP